MLNFFQYINNILFGKNKNTLGKENCSETLSGFMLNRWASFYDQDNCAIVNNTTNKQILVEDVDLLSKYLFLLIPKKAYRKISYLSKSKDKKENQIPLLSKTLEVGTRDAELFIKTTNDKDLEMFLQIYAEQ